MSMIDDAKIESKEMSKLLATTKDFFSQLPNGVIIVDTELTVLYHNQEASCLLSLKHKNMQNEPLQKSIPKVIAKEIGELKSISDEFYLPEIDKYLLISATPLFQDNQHLGAIILLQTPTSNANVQLELDATKKDEIDFNSFFEASYDGIYITDHNGLTLYVNKAHERISGIPRTELIGKYMEEIVNEGLVSRHITSTVVKDKVSITVEQKLLNGKRVIITGNPVLDDNGNVQKVITNVRDITELIELEKELRKTKEKAYLLGEMVLNRLKNKNIICESVCFKETMETAKKVSEKDSNVLLLGETGVGKGVVADFIHSNSSRKNENFLQVNCGALPTNLLESELFGYVAGSFTGASKSGRMGMFELANNGTLFLDEIGELPLNLQANLLRVLQDGEVMRIGATKYTKVNVRVIAATNRDLDKMIEEGNFRADLYYRLNVISITVPPLRDRVDDIPGLAEMTIKGLNEKYKENKSITSNFIEYLKNKDWNGNVREMQNFIEKQFVLSTGAVIDQPILSQNTKKEGLIQINGIIPLKEATNRLEYQLLKKALEEGGTTYRAADILGISQPTFSRKYREIVTNRDKELP